MHLLAELFLNFLQVGLFSFGGGYATIPLIQNTVVLEQHWLTLGEFTDIIAISQMTPGPVAVNTSTFTGMRIAGLPGAAAATLGCVVGGFFISLLLYRVLKKYRSLRGMSDLMGGLRAVSAGLIAAAAGTILLIALTGGSEIGTGAFDLISAAIAGGALLLLRKFHWNPLLVMTVCGAVGGVVYGLL